MKIYYESNGVTLLNGDVLDCLCTLPDNSIHCVVTSPPYWGLRDYGVDGQMGLEATPQEFVAKLVDVFREVRRVLKPDGTCWVNMGDSYSRNRNKAGVENEKATSGEGHSEARHGVHRKRWDDEAGVRPLCLEEARNQAPAEDAMLSLLATRGAKEKDLIGIPWRLAFALQEDGWWLRQDIIWSKPNPMPESVTDRCTKAHEYVFLLTKSATYHYDAEAIKEPSVEPDRKRNDRIGGATGHTVRHSKGGMMQGVANRNKRSVWTIQTEGFAEAHFATFPTKLVEPCILAGCPEGGLVLDPFSGSGTTGLVAIANRRAYVGIELNPDYAAMSVRRFVAATAQKALPLG